MGKRIHLILYLLLPLLFISCSNQKDADEREQAFEDYKGFVEETENTADSEFTEAEIRAMRQPNADTSTWRKESADIMQGYEDRKRRVEDNFSAYDEARQQEIRDLEARYNKAYEKQADKYREVSHRYRLRNELMGLPVSADDLSNITATKLADTYTRFVENLRTKQDSLTQEDWELVEGWWLALNNRKKELESQLNTSAASSIENASADYQQLREKSPAQ